MKRWFYIIVALQLVFLVAETASYEYTRTRGAVVTLKTVPVDPRSLFMGNYIALSYDVSEIDLSRVAVLDPGISKGQLDVVYVGLRPAKPWARPVCVSAEPEGGVPGLVYMKGHTVGRPYANRLGINYGIERYYIPEKRSSEVERWGWQRRRPGVITVEVAVRGSGQAVIKRVLMDGRPLDF